MVFSFSLFFFPSYTHRLSFHRFDAHKWILERGGIFRQSILVHKFFGPPPLAPQKWASWQHTRYGGTASVIARAMGESFSDHIACTVSIVNRFSDPLRWSTRVGGIFRGTSKPVSPWGSSLVTVLRVYRSPKPLFQWPPFIFRADSKPILATSQWSLFFRGLF